MSGKDVKVITYTMPAVPANALAKAENAEVKIVEKSPQKFITGALEPDGSWNVTLGSPDSSNPINRRDYNRFLRGLKAAIGVYLRTHTRQVYRKETEQTKVDMAKAAEVAEQNLRASLVK